MTKIVMPTFKLLNSMFGMVVAVTILLFVANWSQACGRTRTMTKSRGCNNDVQVECAPAAQAPVMAAAPVMKAEVLVPAVTRQVTTTCTTEVPCITSTPFRTTYRGYGGYGSSYSSYGSCDTGGRMRTCTRSHCR